MRAFLALRFPRRYGKDARPEARALSDRKSQNRHEVDLVERLEPEPDDREVGDDNKFMINERTRLRDGVTRFGTDMGGWLGFVREVPNAVEAGYLVEFDGDTQGKITDEFADYCEATHVGEDFEAFDEDELDFLNPPVTPSFLNETQALLSLTLQA